MAKGSKGGNKTTEKNKLNEGEEKPHIKDLKIKSEATGNLITDGDPDDPDLHDGQAWREGRSIEGSN
jgi:hypothetical protein